MDLRMSYLLVFLFLLLLHGRRCDEHVPPPGVPTFLRDSVEQRPQPTNEAYSEAYGSRPLPLREAVESRPDITDATRRLPLRDAVEKRPAPDEPAETRYDVPVQEPAKNYFFALPNTYVVSPNGGYTSLRQSYYSPVQFFRNALANYRVPLPASYQYVETFHRISKEYRGNDRKRIVCFIDSDAANRKYPFNFKPEETDPFSCTHLVYASATLDPTTAYRLTPKNQEFDVVQGGYLSTTALKLKNPKLKVSISLRTSSENFDVMTTNEEYRQNFIESVLVFLEKYNFDGLNIEVPENFAEEYLKRLLNELSRSFKAHNLVLSITLPVDSFGEISGSTLRTIGNLVDFINLKLDNFGDFEPNNYRETPKDRREENLKKLDNAVQYGLNQGLSGAKLNIGVSFFGRTYTLTNQESIEEPGAEGYYTKTAGSLAYFEICDLILNDGYKKATDSTDSPYLVKDDQWINYDDPDSVEHQIDYVRRFKLGGVAVFSVDLDDFRGICGEKSPLLKSLNRKISAQKRLVDEMPAKPYGICDNDGLYSDRTNCAAYFICRNSYSYHLSCGAGMMFNPETGECGYIPAEKCKTSETIFIPDSNQQLKIAPKDDKPKVVCYVTSWAFYRKAEGKFVPENVDENLCTHIIYAFASLDPEKLLLKEFDPWADIDNALYERITSLKGPKILLSLGGWTDSVGDKYTRLVSDGAARRKFVVAAISFLRRHNFDGLHFDWNYPVCWQSNCKKGPASDKANFVKLIQELRKEFDKQSPSLILAASISGYKEVIDVAYDLPKLGKDLDFLSVMTYDYHGFWERKTGHVSPLYGSASNKYPQYNTNFTMQYLVAKGAPKEKLLLGIPFYGQSFTLTNPRSNEEGAVSAGPGEAGEYTKQPGMLAYYEICNRIRASRWPIKSKNSPYTFRGDQWVSFETPDTVSAKAAYIKANGFGGAVAWTIDLDDFGNRCCKGAFPLLKSLNKELGRISDALPAGDDCTKPAQPITPVPPQTTTGADSGAGSTTEHMHWTEKTTTTKKPTTTQVSTWWPTTSTTTTARTTTKAPTTTEVTTIPPPAVVMPEVDKPVMNCDSGDYKEDPRNCNAYYRCVQGEFKKQYCAGGLHWNKQTKTCDWPADAKCDKKSKPQTTTYKPPRRTTPVVITTTTKPSSGDKKCTPGQYYPHEHCSSYYICVNGQLVTQTCGPSLSWNVDENRCDWRFKVRCIGRKELAQKLTSRLKLRGGRPEPYSTCEGNTFAPLAGDCTQYLHCLWGKYEVHQCAPGLHWNNDRQICDWPQTAKCVTDGETIDEIITTEKPVKKPVSTTTISSGSEWEWKPESTTASSGSEWEWHPPIPPTSEQPPLAEPLKPHSGYFKIVCYFTNWAWYRKGAGRYLPEDIDPELCTHIVYGFAVLDFENLIIKAHDSWADFDNQFYKRVTGYKSKGVKVSVAIGGWNDSQGDKYSRLVNNPAARARFIKHILQFLDKYNFDGLDLDWEYPKCWQVDCKKGPDSDKEGFSAWVRELKTAFKPKGYLLSAAVSPSKIVIDAGYDVPVLAENLDWVAVMTYDFHGQWDKQTGHVAPLYYHPDDEVAYYNANYSINYWISEGVPRRKIVMGMPLYGQSFRLEKAENNGLNAKAPGPGEAGAYTRAAGFLAYYEICDNIQNKGWKVVQDPKKRLGPYAYKGDQWVSFDDRDMIRLKSQYIRDMDLGGGMIWALDLDDFKDKCGQGRHPLLTIIRNTLAEEGSGRVELRPAKLEENVVEEPQTPVPAVTAQPIVDKNSEYKVVCYFTNWAWYRQGVGKYLPADIDPDLCTHIVYGFAVLDSGTLTIKPHDSWADLDNKFYEKVTALKAKGIKVTVAIGGWNDSAGDKYSKLANNPGARARFITRVVEFIEENNFDGLDLDWEYPKCWQVDCRKGPESDKQGFADLVRELHEAFQPKGWLLSSAVSPSKAVIDAGYDVPALSRYLDWIAVMCYDYHGQWDKITGHVAPMYAHPEDADATFNTNFTINYWIEQGADRKKLVMGMPTYGQSFSLADNTINGLNAPTYGGGEAGEETRARGFLAYYEICQNVVNKGWSVVRDRKGRIGPYAYQRDQWVSFDDIGMIRHKSEYIKAMGLGGGMIWALDLDDFKNLCGCEEYPLLRTINRVLRGYSIPAPKCILGKTPPSTTPTKKPTRKPTKPSIPASTGPPPTDLPCNGRLFVADDKNCNQYYLCNQGQLTLQTCPSGLFWNRDHCDWPENTKCHPDATTPAPVEEPKESETTTTEGTYIEPVVTPQPGTTPEDGQYKVVCYFTNWAWYRQGAGKYLPGDIDSSLCTHINYGFAVLDSNSLTIKPHDSWADIDNDFYTKVVAYKSKGIKVLIAIGGWNDSEGDKYSRLVNSPSARARFVRHVVEFIEKWGFDGLDLDWEYPKCWQVDCDKGPDTDKDGFASLVEELSAVFKPKGLLLSTAVSPSKAVIDAGYDVVKMNKYFDWIAVMTYDFHGHWDKKTGHVAPLYYYPGDTYDYFNANFTMHYWIEKGASPDKLVMGMPLYGQSFSLADNSKHGLNEASYGKGEAGEYTRAGGFLAFYEICEKVKRRGWNVVRDKQGRIGPYAYSNGQWVSYDDIAEIKRKSDLIKNLGLGGGMIWALDLDDFRNTCGCGRHPLLKTMNYELRGVPSDITVENCT